MNMKHVQIFNGVRCTITTPETHATRLYEGTAKDARMHGGCMIKVFWRNIIEARAVLNEIL